jgi:YVTN family beta-propeller protein
VVTLVARSLIGLALGAAVCSSAAGASEPLKLHVGIRAEFAVAAVGAVWTTDSLDKRVVRIDVATNRVVARIKTKGSSPLGITSGAGSIWVANRNSGTVVRINPKTNKPRTGKPVRVGSGPYALAFGAGSVWVSNESSGTVSRISPAKNRVTKTIRVGGGPNGIVVAFGSVWVADYGGGRVL